MNCRRAAISVGAVALSACAASDPSTLADDLVAIDAVRAEHVRGVNNTDVDLVMNGMAPGVVYLGPGMDPLLGAPALRAFVEPLYHQIRPDITMTPKDVQVVGDVAYEWGLISGSAVLSEGAQPIAMNAKYVYIYRRQSDGSWRIVYDIYNDNAPRQ